MAESLFQWLPAPAVYVCAYFCNASGVSNDSRSWHFTSTGMPCPSNVVDVGLRRPRCFFGRRVASSLGGIENTIESILSIGCENIASVIRNNAPIIPILRCPSDCSTDHCSNNSSPSVSFWMTRCWYWSNGALVFQIYSGYKCSFFLPTRKLSR